MEQNRQIRWAKACYQVVVWLTLGLVIGAFLWMPLLRSLVATQ